MLYFKERTLKCVSKLCMSVIVCVFFICKCRKARFFYGWLGLKTFIYKAFNINRLSF